MKEEYLQCVETRVGGTSTYSVERHVRLDDTIIEKEIMRTVGSAPTSVALDKKNEKGRLYDECYRVGSRMSKDLGLYFSHFTMTA